MRTPFLQPCQAMTVWNHASGLSLHYFPMGSVDSAREEFGPTLEDAQSFVAGVTCNDCGEEAGTAEECRDCGVPTCLCFRDPHDDDVRFCKDCSRVRGCGCRECFDGD